MVYDCSLNYGRYNKCNNREIYWGKKWWSSKKFVGVFSSNFVTSFITFYGLVKKKGSTYPFAILNTDRSNLLGTHWWSILDNCPTKQLFLFDSYGFTGLKAFIMQDNRKIINKVLCGVENFNKKDNIVPLISLKFSISPYQNLSHVEILELSSTAASLFHLTSRFAKVYNRKNELTLYLVDDQLQESTSDTCSMCQLYFYKNLFDHLHHSSIINDDKLIKDIVLELLN